MINGYDIDGLFVNDFSSSTIYSLVKKLLPEILYATAICIVPSNHTTSLSSTRQNNSC